MGAVPPGYLGVIDVGLPGPDLARARALLTEAGHPNGITLRSVVSSISSQQPIMEVVQAQLRRAGDEGVPGCTRGGKAVS